MRFARKIGLWLVAVGIIALGAAFLFGEIGSRPGAYVMAWISSVSGATGALILFVLYVWGPIVIVMHDHGIKVGGTNLLSDQKREDLGAFYGERSKHD